MNDLITKHPMDGVRYTKPVRAPDDIHFLTRDEQIRFLEVAKRSHNYAQYALILETGPRTGEVIGLMKSSKVFGTAARSKRSHRRWTKRLST